MKNVLSIILIITILITPIALAKNVVLTVSQAIKPGDNIKQSVTLQNHKSNAHLEGHIVSDNGWCVWDNGKTVKELNLLPSETRAEVLIIKIPEDIILDNSKCIITFEGSPRYKIEMYLYGIGITILLIIVLFIIIRQIIKKRKRKKKDVNTFMEETM